MFARLAERKSGLYVAIAHVEDFPIKSHKLPQSVGGIMGRRNCFKKIDGHGNYGATTIANVRAYGNQIVRTTNVFRRLFAFCDWPKRKKSRAKCSGKTKNHVARLRFTLCALRREIVGVSGFRHSSD